MFLIQRPGLGRHAPWESSPPGEPSLEAPSNDSEEAPTGVASRFRTCTLHASAKSSPSMQLPDEKRADVLAESFFHLDVKPGSRRHFEHLVRLVVLPGGLAIQFHPARARDDLHSFGEIGAEVERARVNQAERLLAAVGEQQTVADDFAVEIDVGLRDSGDTLKLLRNRCHKGFYLTTPALNCKTRTASTIATHYAVGTHSFERQHFQGYGRRGLPSHLRQETIKGQNGGQWSW